MLAPTSGREDGVVGMFLMRDDRLIASVQGHLRELSGLVVTAS